MDFHYLHLRTFAHATEDLDAVRHALRVVAGAEHPDDEDPGEIQVTEAQGHHGNPIRILELKLDRAPVIRDVWTRLADVPGALHTLRADLEDRLDEGCNVYLRLSKQRAAQGTLAMATDDDVIHMRAKVAAFPAKRSAAVEKMQALLDELMA